MSPAHAAMTTTTDALGKIDRTQLITTLEREDVQQQLTEMGVDPDEAIARVGQMTDEEVVALNQKVAELPAGAGHLSTVQVLLIILLIVILI